MPEPTTDPSQIKKKQWCMLLIGISVFGAVFFGLYSLFKNEALPLDPKRNEETLHFETPLTHVDAESIWMERAQNQLTQQTKTTQGLNQQLELLQQSKETQDKTSQEQAQTLQNLQAEVKLLQKQFAHIKSGDSRLAGNEFQAGTDEKGDDTGSINDHTLSLSSSKRILKRPMRNPLNFVPAGTFVRAIALGAADAPAGVTSQANPTPMLFRLLDRGTLPNHRQSQLKNCMATAAVVGDVSSERGEIRLERLSCTRLNGEIIEIPVEATVFGPDGKNGVRGNPLWREGALLQRAFAAGTLSGISTGIAHGYTASSLNPWGNAQTVIDSGKIGQYGIATGLSNAAEKLAEYNVKRAEQYHPVIQLSAGTLVDIVFLKGFYLDGRQLNDHDQDYLASNTSLESGTNAPMPSGQDQTEGHPASLPLTPQQIQSLKQKNAELGYF
jgi:conjugal transfer pilus assembly protein TraB